MAPGDPQEDQVELMRRQDAVRLRLRVKPAGRRERMIGAYGGALKLEVQAPPDRGKANAAVVALLARELGVDRSLVALVAGLTSQDKVVELRGVAAETLRERLSAHGLQASIA